MEEKKKKERTIRSETTKVFLVIFGILSIVGIFSIFSAMRGASTFTTIREVHLKQFKAAEIMKQKALDVIAIYYLLATDQDQEVMMGELLRYNPLVESFDQSSKLLEKSYDSEEGPVKDKVLTLLKETKIVFDELNENCRQMLFPTYRGEKADTKKLPAINDGVTKFKAKLDEIEGIVSKQLEDESNKAQSLLNFSTIVGIVVTLLAVFITIGLINYLMKFLSVSLLPISNLMHNMRQAVFSVDKGLNIISPVSGYSNVVFDEDIVGKNLQDVAFRDLEAGGEVYTQHRVAMDLVFGEDEFQWSLVQDSLLRQVAVKPRGGDEKNEKILKLSYAPLLEKGVIQNIMVVAEDVTEMEKLRIEGMKKQGKIEIIKGLMGIDTADLDSFLQTAYEQIKLSYSLLPKLDGDLQARQALFRTLHTLKGNSRMYKLNSVSEAVHTAENSVVEMNRRISEKEPVGDLPEMIRVGIQAVEVILSEHCKMASGFFGIKDYYSEYAEAQIRKAVYGMELLVESGTVAEKFAQLAPTFDSAIAASNYFEAQDLADSLTLIKTSPGATKEEWEKNSALLCETYIKMLIKKGNLRPYEVDAADWGVLFAKLVELTLALEMNADKAKLLEIAKGLSSVAEKTSMLVATHRANSIIDRLNSGDSTDHKSDILSLWGLFVSVSSLDMQKNIEKQGKAHGNSITKDFMKSLLATNNLNSRTILSSVFTSMEDLLITMSQFWSIAGKILNVAPEEAVNLFLGVTASRTEESIIYHLKDGVISQWNTVGGMMKGTGLGPFHQYAKNQIDFKIDTMRLLGTFKAKNGVPLFGALEQMMKVPASLLSEIHELTEKMQKQSADEVQGTVKDLHKVIQRVHESPLANMFINMTPMVQELAGRLGKNLEFLVSGDQVYVGRDRANVLRDALVHMIRNTIDHGVEMPDERASKGKSEKGQLIIDIEQIDDQITVSVADDGRGIDVERLTAKAVKSGFISQEKSDSMSHHDKLNLVFLPNLSTKEEVTAISGRGVGMDAVKSIVEDFGGELDIDSTLGQGVKISITFTHDAPGSMSANNNMNEAVLTDLLSNMTPMVTELAQGLNKDIDYVVKGEAIVVSRERSGALRDALIHLVRNTLDHGIESSQERSGKGKGSKGQLTIDLVKTENEISVSVIDDGRGIDTDKLVSKAVKLGLITQDKANAMNDQEKVDLSFLPNLSTKDEVTAISGRGVGMDAVKSIVEGFGGKVVLNSSADKGLKVVITFKPEPGVGMGAKKTANANDVSMEKVCSNMSTVALEIAQSLSKKIDYIVSGDVPVSRDRSNALRDALVHVIRNSIDHGIENSKDRDASGKGEKGKVLITLASTPQAVRVSVLDDGGGIDIEKLSKKAVKLGMISEEKLASMSEQEKINLAFLPNLSTKDQVTELSGRGVGMDAVKSIVEGFGGKVELISTAGKGVEVVITFSPEAGIGASGRRVVGNANDISMEKVCSNMSTVALEIAQGLSKKIDYIVSGDVPVSRDRSNALRDALVHVIRNSIDHGIENSKDRDASGKGEKGKVLISLASTPQAVRVSVLDDGGGIDIEKLSKKAVKLGMISEEKLASMSEQEKINLAFLPNLSTKDQVTELSGRGVGMDAVKSIVEGFGGKVELISTAGKGVEVVITFSPEAGVGTSARRAIPNANDVSMEKVCSNMSSVALEIAQGLSKKIDYIVSGDVSVSRDRSNALRDSLVHVIRNSIDHGIENSKDRDAAGKSATGKVLISLASTPQAVRISVLDDGGGIDIEKLSKKAVKLGMITDEKLASMSEQEKINLAFLPNLSTKDQVTELSGRGVGMDAVKSIVEGFGGKVELISTAGKGVEVVITFSPEAGVGTSARRAIPNANDVSMEKVCSNMSSVALEIAQGLSKKIDYIVSGDVSVSRDRSNALRDSLVHVIRNSIDHGIENSKDRDAAGKSATGKVLISLGSTPQGARVSVLDDGGGIDIEKLSKKAVKLGMITEEKLASMSEQEKINLAFLPNLSTKDQVTELSGRGVGMDAVKSIVEGFGGKVELISTAGKGVEVVITFGRESGPKKVIQNANDVSLEKVFSNMSSVALEIAQGLSKKIDYIVSGDISVPKDRSNALRDALVHLIRNSIDHGIEMPSERESKSKSAKGKVFISLEKTPQGMSISVVDDGRGVDIEKLTSKALKLGMITNEKLAEMTEQEKINLAFLANLSTKDQVTELSGRGVGMDAVKSIVEGLNGKVLLSSEQDKGVTVKILFS